MIKNKKLFKIVAIAAIAVTIITSCKEENKKNDGDFSTTLIDLRIEAFDIENATNIALSTVTKELDVTRADADGFTYTTYEDPILVKFTNTDEILSVPLVTYVSKDNIEIPKWKAKELHKLNDNYILLSTDTHNMNDIYAAGYLVRLSDYKVFEINSPGNIHLTDSGIVKGDKEIAPIDLKIIKSNKLAVVVHASIEGKKSPYIFNLPNAANPSFEDLNSSIKSEDIVAVNEKYIIYDSAMKVYAYNRATKESKLIKDYSINYEHYIGVNPETMQIFIHIIYQSGDFENDDLYAYTLTSSGDFSEELLHRGGRNSGNMTFYSPTYLITYNKTPYFYGHDYNENHHKGIYKYSNKGLILANESHLKSEEAGISKINKISDNLVAITDDNNIIYIFDAITEKMRTAFEYDKYSNKYRLDSTSINGKILQIRGVRLSDSKRVLLSYDLTQEEDTLEILEIYNERESEINNLIPIN